MAGVALALLLLAGAGEALVAPDVMHSWTSLDYVWDSTHVRADYVASGAFVPDNCALTGVKVFNSTRVFASVPRWRPGVPATLAEVVGSGSDSLLQPYPSWDMQTIGDDNALQYVQSMEIDAETGFMWIVDVGRLNLLDTPELVDGQAKLVVWDIERDELVRLYRFPDAVAPFNASFLNDIVIDTKDKVAYISDAGTGAGGLVVYDWASNSSARYEGPSTQADPAVSFDIDGVFYGNDTFTTPEDGIALGPGFHTLYFCALQGVELHAVATSVLRDFSTTDAEFDAAVQPQGEKAGPSDGIAYSNNGLLYFGDLNGMTLYQWDPQSGKSVSAGQLQLIDSSTAYRWIDTFAFDGLGYLWFTVNRLDQYIVNGVSPGFDIYRLFIDGNSYMEGWPSPAGDDDAPPDVLSDDDDSSGSHTDDDGNGNDGTAVVIEILLGVVVVAALAFAYRLHSDRAKRAQSVLEDGYAPL